MFVVTGRALSTGLTRAELWRGLVRKAEAPVEFVNAITDCRVLERGDDWLVREIVLRGDRVRERVTFDPEREVRFERITGPVAGTIVNRIERDERGRLSVRFTFRLEVDDLAPGSAAEARYAAQMKDSYLAAIRTTLARARLLARQSPANHRSAP